MNNIISSTVASSAAPVSVQMSPPAVQSASRGSAITRAYMGVHADTIACGRLMGTYLGACGALASITAGSVFAAAGSPLPTLCLAAGVPAAAGVVGCIMFGVCDPYGHPGYDSDKHECKSVGTETTGNWGG